MSVAHNQGKIVAISGKIIAVAVDGSQRVLKVGDTVAVGERLIVPADGVIELRADNGNIVKIAEARDLTITDDVFGPATADVTDAALATLPSEAQQVLAALQDGQDPLQNLEATAAGLAAGGGEDGGSSYTILGRVSEDITDASLAAGTASNASIETIAATTGSLDASQTFNQPSVLVADSNFIDEDGMATGNLLENDSDTDDALSVVGITVNDRTFPVDTEEGAFIELESGVLQVGANGDYIFSPANNWNGTVPVITYTTNTGSSSTLTITVNPVDDPSVLKADSNTVEEDTPAKGNVLENDSDIDSELSVVSITVDGRSYTVDAQDGAFVELESGMLEVSANGDYIFTPASNWHGTVPTVAYTTNTGSSSTLSISVTPVTDGFSDGNETVSVAEDTTLEGSVLGGTSSVDGDVRVTGFSIGANNYAAGASASIDGVGSLQLNADGSYVFTPAANYHGAVPLVSYTVSDGVSSDSSTLSISVTPVTDGFTDGNETVSVAEDTTLAGSVLGGTSSVDGDVRVTGFSIGANNYAAGASASIDGVGSLQLNADGSYVFTPAANYHGAVPLVSYTVSDGVSSDSSTLSISVTPVDDKGVAGIDSNTTLEDTAVSGNVLDNDRDIDSNLTVAGFSVDINGDGTTESFTAGQTATINGVGTLTLGSDGGYIFAPAGNWSGTVPAVTYTTNTGTSATLNIDVTPVADKPALTINNYQTVASMNFEDVALPSQGYSETIQINTISGTSTVGTWSTWNGSGYVEVGKEGIYQGGSSSNKVMEIEAATGDKTLYADIQVEAGRFYELDFDVAARNGHIASSGMSVSLVKLDASGNPVTGSSVVLYTFSPTDSSWHNVTENWTAEASGTYRLIFTSTDSGNSYGALLDNITFSAVENKGYENSFFSLGDINTALTDTDGSEELAVEISGLPVGAVLKDGAGHELTVGANGKLDVTGWSLTTLQIQVDQPGNYTLTVTSTSSEVVNGSVVDSDSSQANFTITVLDAANFTDANEVATMAEDGVLSGSVLTGTSSIEGAVTVSSFSIGGSSYTAGQTATVANIGALKVNADGSYVFTPVKDFNGPVPTVNYVVTDGKTTDASTLNITVTAVEDTPVSYSSGNSGAYWLMNYTSNANEFDMKVKNGTMTLAVGESLHWDILVTDSDQNATLTLINKSLPSGATLSSERLYAENGEVMLRVYLTVTGNSAITLSQDNQFTIDVNGASGKALLINSDEYVGVHPNNEYDYSTQFDNGNASQWDDTDWLSSNVRGGELATSSSSQAGQTVSYSNGEDIVYGTTGGDSLSGGADNDFIDGRAGNDTLHGDTGNDVVLGGHGNDTLYGDAGNDYLDGGRGSDALYGGSGNDVLKGGADSDTLVGGAGNDTLTGGTGIDTFKWALGDAGAVGSAARDSITDFKAGVGGDVLDLKDLLQGENSSNLSNYLHFDKDAAGNAVVQISSSGNVVGGFDQAITLEGVKLSDLGAGDANIINNLLANGNLKVDL